jgi:hypothetical protein
MCKPPSLRLVLVTTFLLSLSWLIPGMGAPVTFAQEGSAESAPEISPEMAAQALPLCDPISPFPEGVTIIPPAADLPPQLAALSGAWQGRGVGGRASRLVVESVESTVARVAFGIEGAGDQQGISQAVAVRSEVPLRPDGGLTLGTQPRIDVSLATDHNSLDVAVRVGGLVLRRVTMTRCSL